MTAPEAVPPQVHPPSQRGRRLAAVGLLAAGLAGAWWSVRPRATEVEVAWLLGHAEVLVGDTLVDRRRLVQFAWRVPDGPGSTRSRERHVLDFAPGQAPDATAPFTLELPAGVDAVEVTCRFALGPDSAPLRTRGRVAIDRQREGVQPVDVGTCGSLER